VRLIDNQVNSFAPQPVAPGTTYRFERLPSQQADTAQDHLETLAQHALEKAGLKHATAGALRVQVTAVQRQESTANSSGLNIGLGVGWVFGNGSIFIGNQGGMFPDLYARPNYWRQVSLIMRDAAGAVVFESHATHEGIWSDGDAVLTAMFDAALRDFPTPPHGVRRVDIEIPR
jgi:hypothetical protein